MRADARVLRAKLTPIYPDARRSSREPVAGLGAANAERFLAANASVPGSRPPPDHCAVGLPLTQVPFRGGVPNQLRSIYN
jgi:hypothetical protein